MSLLGGESIKMLQKLFKTGSDDSSDEEPQPDGPQFGPGDIGEPVAKPSKKKITTVDPTEHITPCTYAPLQSSPAADPKPQTLEEWELQQQCEAEALFETRKRPEYRISYRQTVATEDIYLQMNCKSPSTASCENMIIDVDLTGEEDTIGIHHIELSVKEQGIVVATPKYRLDLMLPHRIDPDKGNAAWLSDVKTLRLTLRMVRELDFVNF
ncbi:dynein assembly factor 6, axonemal-like [Anopheles albimanus]|uniref:PIH1_CS domain-containing protein n=1 Tax=Anopheles albimanus TaxID=7167 RepID=A0A182F5I3_ANOAL|nr:dynein assembly factor 6, axonemal-like [Anopheles albimanus]